MAARCTWQRVGGQSRGRTFLLADVALPIIGADFLKHFGLLVDLGEMRLLARGGGWSHHLVEPSRSSLFATLGVLVAQKKKKRRRCEVLPLPSGQAVAASAARDGSPEASTIAVVYLGRSWMWWSQHVLEMPARRPSSYVPSRTC